MPIISDTLEKEPDMVEEKRVFTDCKDLTLSNILEMCNEGDIIPQPEYQRDYIMDDKKPLN